MSEYEEMKRKSIDNIEGYTDSQGRRRGNTENARSYAIFAHTEAIREMTEVLKEKL